MVNCVVKSALRGCWEDEMSVCEEFGRAEGPALKSIDVLYQTLRLPWSSIQQPSKLWPRLLRPIFEAGVSVFVYGIPWPFGGKSAKWIQGLDIINWYVPPLTLDKWLLATAKGFHSICFCVSGSTESDLTCTGHSPRFELKESRRQVAVSYPECQSHLTPHLSLFSLLATGMGLWESGAVWDLNVYYVKGYKMRF